MSPFPSVVFSRGARVLALVLALGCAVSACTRGGAEVERRSGAGAAPGATVYYCPMHPSYRSDHAGNCPVCNMELIPLEEGMEAGDAAPIEGHATVTIQPRRQQLISVQSALVERKPAVRTIRAAGRV